MGKIKQNFKNINNTQSKNTKTIFIMKDNDKEELEKEYLWKRHHGED